MKIEYAASEDVESRPMLLCNAHATFSKAGSAALRLHSGFAEEKSCSCLVFFSCVRGCQLKIKFPTT